MSQKKYYTILILFFIGLLTADAQQKSAQRPVKPKPVKNNPTVAINMGIQAIHFIKNSRIKIRWAPSNEQSWRMGNKYGYILERRTIMRGEEILNSAEQIKSFRTIHFIKDSIQYWEPLVPVNDNAAVMAQALFGETFELDLNNSGNSTKGESMLSKSEENKQRFVFGMYAADNDFSVAERAGLGFTDTATKLNEKYFYRIYSAAPKKLVKSDTALLFVSFKDIMQLPQTPDIAVEPSNKSITLIWDMERTKQYYNAFIIQQSADSGRTFRNLTQRPYSSMAQGNDPRLPNSVVYVDTLTKMGVSYKYRTAGISIFGEKGPWSQVAEGKCLPLLEGVPGIQGIHINPNGQAVLNWYYEDSIRNKVAGFEINHSIDPDGVYKKIIGDIDSKYSEIILPDSLPSGYLIVKAVSKEGISRTSFPYLYQPEDSIPPSAPSGVTATIDSTGKVELKWLPNTEKDLLGYKVFRTMVKGTEHAVLVDTVWPSSVYYDTLDLKLINRKVYYTVTALDYRFNQSSMSPEIEVVKPDIIPPTSPVFSDYKLKEGEVELFWINPTDEDVAEVKVMRRLTSGTDWKMIFSTKNKNIGSYKDGDIESEKKYSYKLVAIDQSGLNSPDAQVLTLQALPVVNRKAIKSLDFDLDREKKLIYLHWQLVEKVPVKSIEIFRGTSEEPLSLFKVLEGKTKDMLDNELLINTRYKYGVRVLLTNGIYSEMLIKEINY